MAVADTHLYDCGAFGHLTRAQIGLVAGLTDSAVAARLSTGLRGAALCAPRGTSRTRIGHAAHWAHWLPALQPVWPAHGTPQPLAPCIRSAA